MDWYSDVGYLVSLDCDFVVRFFCVFFYVGVDLLSCVMEFWLGE